MYFKYGNYQHDAADVQLSLTKTAQRTERGRKKGVDWKMTLDGTLLPSTATQANVRTAIRDLESAYSEDGKNAVLHHDDGTASPHAMYNNSFRGGVRVASIEYPADIYATGLKYKFVLEGIEDTSDDELLFFKEQIVVVGTGGPVFVYVPLSLGAPQRQIIRQRTSKTIMQSGRATGQSNYPSAPGPLMPADEHEEQRRITHTSPRRDDDELTEYGVEWVYQFETTGRAAIRPNIR